MIVAPLAVPPDLVVHRLVGPSSGQGLGVDGEGAIGEPLSQGSAEADLLAVDDAGWQERFEGLLKDVLGGGAVQLETVRDSPHALHEIVIEEG